MGSGFFGSGTSPWSDWLEEDKAGQRAAYFSFGPQFGQAPSQRRYYENSFDRIQNEYLGALGQQARSGEAPSLRFGDFLEDFPFTQRYLSQPPSQRGGNFSSRYTPRTRFIRPF
jgi:hypothetical protein